MSFFPEDLKWLKRLGENSPLSHEPILNLKITAIFRKPFFVMLNLNLITAHCFRSNRHLFSWQFFFKVEHLLGLSGCQDGQ